MAIQGKQLRLAVMSRAAQNARIAEREEPGETEDRAESAQYENGEEGREQIGGGPITPRETVGQITPRRPRRPF